MTDRELLELAAKAAGYEFEFSRDSIGGWLVGKYGEDSDGDRCEREYWRPLTDDGDALRLAVKLRLTLDIERDRCCVSVGDHTGRFGVQPWGKEGPEGATRRAIVRAAAQIGRAMG